MVRKIHKRQKTLILTKMDKKNENKNLKIYNQKKWIL